MYSEAIDVNQDIATTGVSTAKKGANQAEKEVQAAVNTKRKISNPEEWCWMICAGSKGEKNNDSADIL